MTTREEQFGAAVLALSNRFHRHHRHQGHRRLHRNGARLEKGVQALALLTLLRRLAPRPGAHRG